MAGHGHIEGHGNKAIALLIAVLALFLALSETLGKSAQTKVLGYNVDAANLWAFFQARTIRQTTLRTAVEQAALLPPSEQVTQQVARWNEQIQRWESEPATATRPGEGRRELMQRATYAEAQREVARTRFYHYELASGLFQIAIVLASASIVTGVALLVWIAGLGGLIGIVFTGVGLFAPQVGLPILRALGML